MTAPATLMLAKMLMPEIGQPVTAGGVDVQVEKPGVNIIDAASRGASDGLQLALNIGAMLIAFIGLIALVNGILTALHNANHMHWFPGSMQAILGRLFAPIAWLLGVKYNDCATVGNLLGERLILNEFVAFVDLGKIGNTLDARSFVIATYALCGFANLSSVAIQVGGIGALGAYPKVGSGAAGNESGRGRNHGEFHVGVHCGNAVVIGVVLGSGLGGFADTLEHRQRNAVFRDPGLASVDGAGACGEAGRGADRFDAGDRAGRARASLRRLHGARR